LHRADLARADGVAETAETIDVPCDDSMAFVYATMLPHLATTLKCVVVSPGPVTGSATARRVPGAMPNDSHFANDAMRYYA